MKKNGTIPLFFFFFAFGFPRQAHSLFCDLSRTLGEFSLPVFGIGMTLWDSPFPVPLSRPAHNASRSANLTISGTANRRAATKTRQHGRCLVDCGTRGSRSRCDRTKNVRDCAGISPTAASPLLFFCCLAERCTTTQIVGPKRGMQPRPCELTRLSFFFVFFLGVVTRLGRRWRPAGGYAPLWSSRNPTTPAALFLFFLPHLLSAGPTYN